MDKLFEHSPQIIEQAAKSPLGVAALIILALSILGFLFFRNASIKVRVGIFGFIGFVGFALFIFSLFRSPAANTKLDSALQLVDMSFVEPTAFPKEPTKLDIKLRNTGEKVAFLKQVNFNVEKIWELQPLLARKMAVQPSQNYDVSLRISRTPYSISKSISHSIEPNAVDRFTFALDIGKEQPRVGDYVFLMTVELLYDEDNKSLLSQKLPFAIVDENSIYEYSDRLFRPREVKYIRDYMIHNKSVVEEIMKEINSVDDIKSELLKKLIRIISTYPTLP